MKYSSILIVALLCLGSSEAITLTKKSHSKEDPPAEEAPAAEAAEPAEAAPAKKEEKKGDKKDAAKEEKKRVAAALELKKKSTPGLDYSKTGMHLKPGQANSFNDEYVDGIPTLKAGKEIKDGERKKLQGMIDKQEKVY